MCGLDYRDDASLSVSRSRRCALWGARSTRRVDGGGGYARRLRGGARRRAARAAGRRSRCSSTWTRTDDERDAGRRRGRLHRVQDGRALARLVDVRHQQDGPTAALRQRRSRVVEREHRERDRRRPSSRADSLDRRPCSQSVEATTTTTTGIDGDDVRHAAPGRATTPVITLDAKLNGVDRPDVPLLRAGRADQRQLPGHADRSADARAVDLRDEA